jgi:hypothetical protein
MLDISGAGLDRMTTARFDALVPGTVAVDESGTTLAPAGGAIEDVGTVAWRPARDGLPAPGSDRVR